MRFDAVFSIAVLAAALGGLAGYQVAERVFVVNLKEPHPVEGTVEVAKPIPHTTVESLFDIVVAPASRDEPSLWADAGVLETNGFTSAVLSLHGQFRGNPGVTGSIGLLLVPDEENIQRALAEGEAHLALEAAAESVPDGRLYFSASRSGLAIGFPRYRVFLYNTTDRSAVVNVFAYLIH